MKIIVDDQSLGQIGGQVNRWIVYYHTTQQKAIIHHNIREQIGIQIGPLFNTIAEHISENYNRQ